MSSPADCITLTELLRNCPKDVPLLALGQTIFWDEPMKAGVALALRASGSRRPFIAGIHDTDYFAKLPSGRREPGRFRAFPHNDTTTRGIWSAAAEFSTLFGSETVVTREALVTGGLRVHALMLARPNILDSATEAWGWRGVVSLDESPPIAAEVPMKGLFPVLKETLDWAVSDAVKSIVGRGRADSERQAEALLGLLTEPDSPRYLGETYREQLQAAYDFTAGEPVPLEATQTSELMRFNRATCHLPRFELLELFINPETHARARAAYDEAIKGGSGQYELARFGSGAIPFDVVIPGHGRGTLRLGTRGAVIMTRRPNFLTFKRPITLLSELAAALEDKFGRDCVLVGKAVALIGMLGREFSFVFHEGASSYVKHSRKMHQIIARDIRPLELHPILRVRYATWDSLANVQTWFKLPWVFTAAFGTSELGAASFAARWRQVTEEQARFLSKLGGLRRPIDLIQYLDQKKGGSWHVLADQYSDLLGQLVEVVAKIDEYRAERKELYARRRGLKRARVAAEINLGQHWRSRIWEKDPSKIDMAERASRQQILANIIVELHQIDRRMVELRVAQNEIVSDPKIKSVHKRRQEIELEAELKRLTLIREAVVTSRGLVNADARPSAWWFPVVSPDGTWFRETMKSARAYWEPII